MEEKSFKELEKELAEILQRVEHADYEELDDLLVDYDAGKKVIEELTKRLDKAKNSIKKVNR
jgi:exonuclease VII small subunit